VAHLLPDPADLGSSPSVSEFFLAEILMLMWLIIGTAKTIFDSEHVNMISTHFVLPSGMLQKPIFLP